jgi:WD40 repeat protein
MEYGVAFMANTISMFVIAVVMGLNAAWGQASLSYSPIYFVPGGEFLSFPAVGPPITVDAPPGLTPNFLPVGSSDGIAIYGEDAVGDGLIKIEFHPTRQSIVAGSAGLRRVFSLTLSRPSGKLFVSAQRTIAGELQCGDFEIAPGAGTIRPLRIGRYPDCGGSISPDGTRELHWARDQLSILDLRSGVMIPLARGPASAVWSPDGKWIAAAVGQPSRIEIIDATDPARKRKLSKADGPLVWSPDSRYLLQLRSQFSCIPTLFGESLEVIDTFTGKRSLVKSSHCQIIHGAIAWLDNGAVH